jgi:hypothetical protein
VSDTCLSTVFSRREKMFTVVSSGWPLIARM